MVELRCSIARSFSIVVRSFLSHISPKSIGFELEHARVNPTHTRAHQIQNEYTAFSYINIFTKVTNIYIYTENTWVSWAKDTKGRMKCKCPENVYIRLMVCLSLFNLPHKHTHTDTYTRSMNNGLLHRKGVFCYIYIFYSICVYVYIDKLIFHELATLKPR